MEQNEKSVLIVGGGLSGLTLAYLLNQKNINATLLEAAPRLGGRIETMKGDLNTPLELGATWFSDLHPTLLQFLAELGLDKYPQFSGGISLFQTKSFEPPQQFQVPQGDGQSYRIKGGTQALIDALERKINLTQVHLNTKVTAINETKDGLVVTANNGATFKGCKAVLCLPPQLVGVNISFSPPLPTALTAVLPAVQTWMAGSVKFVLEYANSFWRENGYSGMLYSHCGIIAEMYDHTNFEEDKFGFTGFLNAGAANYTQAVRKEFVLRQLTELLGEQAANSTTYYDKVWDNPFVVSGNQIIHRPHQNNGHPVLQESYLNYKLYFAGTESARESSGYMEGAIVAAKRVFNLIIKD